MTAVITPDYAALLNEARATYHTIMMGGQARVFVDQNSERIEYNPANLNKLAAYIAWLEIMAGVRVGGGPLRGAFL